MSPDLYLLAAYLTALSMSGGLHVPVLDPMVRATRTEAGGRAMSVRDDLIEIFDAKGPHHLFTSEEVADDILQRHAHELAEKIRAKDWDGPCSHGCCSGDTPEAAADLIDPEVEQ